MSRAIALLMTLIIAACSTDKAAPIPGGFWQVLNAGQWDVNPALVQPPVMPIEAK